MKFYARPGGERRRSSPGRERQGKDKCKFKQRAQHTRSVPTERHVMSAHSFTLIIGNLTKDPVIKSVNTANGMKSVCSFRVAVNRIGKAGGVDYFPVTVWETQGENCFKFLKKGSECAVAGEIRTSEDEKNGVRRFFWELKAETFGGVKFLRTPKGTVVNADLSEDDPVVIDEPVEVPVLAGVGAESDIPF